MRTMESGNESELFGFFCFKLNFSEVSLNFLFIACLICIILAIKREIYGNRENNVCSQRRKSCLKRQWLMMNDHRARGFSFKELNMLVHLHNEKLASIREVLAWGLGSANSQAIWILLFTLKTIYFDDVEEIHLILTNWEQNSKHVNWFVKI